MFTNTSINANILFFVGGPVWSIQPEPQTVNKDSVVYIHCVAFGNPTPSISWYHVQGIGQESLIEVRCVPDIPMRYNDNAETMLLRYITAFVLSCGIIHVKVHEMNTKYLIG